VAEDLVSEAPGDMGGGGAARGRPRQLLRMNPDAAFVVGVKISMHQLSIMVANLRADPLAALILPIRSSRLGPEVIASIIEDGVRAAVQEAELSIAEIRGMGVGLPGFIDSRAGVSHWSPILGDRPTPFAKMLQDRLGLPVVIQNDANMVARAERWFGHGQDVDDFAVVTLEAGVGLGLYLHGELQEGAHGLGSEFGHTKLSLEGGPRCQCGQLGCLEAYVGSFALLREGHRRLEAGPVLDQMQIEREVRRLAELARAGNADLRAVFERAGAVLGVGMANLANLVDPAKIVLSGAGIHAADLMIPALRSAFLANTHRGVSGRCEIIVREWGDDVWARGAASLILERLYRAPRLKGTIPTASATI
jgi:predicted NBD/HSP70 family sugar kinase